METIKGGIHSYPIKINKNISIHIQTPGSWTDIMGHEKKVEWENGQTFSPYKSPSPDGIIPAFLPKGNYV